MPRDGLLEAALELARTLSERSPHAMGVIKELAAETRDLPLSRGDAPRGAGLHQAASAARTAPRAWWRSSRSASRSSPDDEGGRPPRDRPAARPWRTCPSRAGRGTVPRRRAGGGDQLRRRPDPERAVPAAAAAAGRSSATRSPATWATGACSRSCAAAAAATRSGSSWTTSGSSTCPTRRELRGGSSVPDDLPDRVDPVDAAGAHPSRLERARDRRGGRSRHGGDPGRGLLRRERHGRSRLGGEARARAPARRQRTVTYEEIGELDDIDVAFDPVGGPVFAACIKSLRPLGVAIGIGFAGGAWEPVDPARLVGRNVGVQGFYLGRLMGFRAELVQQEVA